jgi:hypothetical protein
MKNTVRLTESDLVRLVEKVLSEQTPQPGPKLTTTTKPSNQFGPYCKIGTSQGIIRQHATSKGGPNVNMGETGFGLFDGSGKLICKISTKHIQGGYVTRPS